MSQKQNYPWQNHHTVDHMLEINRIDSWLRGVKDCAPSTGKKLSDTFNHHSLAFTGVTESEIKQTTGFKKLLDTCSDLDVQVDVKIEAGSRIEVDFKPGQPFSESHIFEKSAKRLLLV